MARIVGVISLATGALLNLAIGSYAGKGTGENALLRQLLPVFKQGDIILGDCYYASFFLVATFIKMGIDVVFPLHASRHCDFRRGKRLGKKIILLSGKNQRDLNGWMKRITLIFRIKSLCVKFRSRMNKRDFEQNRE